MTTRTNLSALALKYSTLTVFFMIALVAAGTYAFFSLGRGEDPPFTIKQMVVSATWPGATSREMEQQVTEKIETKLQELPYFYYVNSYTKPGETVIYVSLRDDTPPAKVPDLWYQVRKKVGDIKGTLPAGVNGPFFNDEYGDTYSLIWAFEADGFSPVEVKDIVKAARQRLLRVPDVTKADLLGLQDEKIYIEFSHTRLAMLGVPVDQILEVVRKQNAIVATGTVETKGERVTVRVDGAPVTAQELAALPFSANGRTLTLSDVAEIKRGYQDPQQISMRFKGKPVIGLGVVMAPGGNVQTLGKALEGAMTEVEASLPVGITVHRVANQPEVVDKSFEEFISSLLEALAIVLVVSFISLGVRTGIIVAMSVPLVLAITFVGMMLLGIDFQRISLGALIIALGLLVDDAIIAVEMMMVKLEQGASRLEAATYAYTSTAFPMLTGTLVTAIGFVPVGFARSSAGEYTNSIFWVVGLSLIISWFVAVLFTPWMGYHLLPQPKVRHADPYDGRLYRVFRRLVVWCVTWRKTTIAITALAFVASMGAFTLVQKQFFPTANRPELIVDMKLAQGASWKATDKEVRKLEKWLGENPTRLLHRLCRRRQSALLPADRTRAHQRQFRPGHRHDQGPWGARAGLCRARQAVCRRFRGRARPRAAAAKRPTGRLPGDVPRARRGAAAGPCRGRAGAAGLQGRSGHARRQLRLERARQDGAARGRPEQGARARRQFADPGQHAADPAVGRDRDPVPRGHRIDRRGGPRRGARAAERRGAGGDRLSHRQRRRGVARPARDAALRARGADPVAAQQGAADDGARRRDRRRAGPRRRGPHRHGAGPLRAELPPGYRIEVGGDKEESAKSQGSIFKMMPLMAFLMIMFLMIQLKSFSKLALVLLTAPLGLIGVSLFLLVFNQPFGFVSLLGVIALAGMIMRNSVILVDQIDQDIAAGHSKWDAVIDATVRRARPILLTAGTAIFAMIPLSRSVFWGPMAVALMGGLLVATALTLLFLPALYAAWFRVKRPAVEAALVEGAAGHPPLAIAAE